MKNVVRYLRRVALPKEGDRPTDGELLESFLTTRDEAAFETLLRRHGPMVLGVCRRTLRNAHDAEDAFQATFLVLVCKASTIRPRERVGNWLYGVAYRTALKARAMNARRRLKESAAREVVRPEPTTAPEDALLKHLDAEISRLPDKYRVPVVLCELEGKSRKEAARLLGLAEGTLSWRLAWARKTLARRLSRRGMPLSAGALTVALSGETATAGVPPTLLATTASTALAVAAGQSLTAGAVPAQVATLTEGVLKAMLLSKLKLLWAVALVVSIGAGASGLAYRATAADPAQGREAPVRARVQDELEELRLEVEALRKGLHTTRERVKSLEGEVETLKRQRVGGMGGMMGMGPTMGGGLGGGGFGGGMGRGFGGGMGGIGMGRGQAQATKPKAPDDPLADAEKALKELRQRPDNKQAAEALKRAVEQLEKQPKPKENPGK
jgi:RNA polymerase sigma factor (sigma-70 family)